VQSDLGPSGSTGDSLVSVAVLSAGRGFVLHGPGAETDWERLTRMGGAAR
jgi:hypothetical protein